METINIPISDHTLFSKDARLAKLPQFHKIVDILFKLHRQGILNDLRGNCITAGDMIQTALAHIGIESEIVEVQACVYLKGEKTEFFFIGYDGNEFPNQVDTHAIVVTKNTPYPILIDTSISFLLPQHHPYIVEIAESKDVTNIAEFDFGEFKITYQPKKNVKVPLIHTKTLADRIAEEQKTRATLKKLSTFVWIVMGISVFNLVLNFSQIILRVVFDIF